MSSPLATGTTITDGRRTGYVICTVGRSGSTWLAELLASTGVLGRPSEYFSTGFQRMLNGPDYPADRRAQVDHVLQAGATPNGVYGFKIFPVHLDDLVRYVDWMEAFPNLRFVHWRRRDVLGQALSRVRAEQTRQWRSTQPAHASARYDGEAILEAMRWAVIQDARWNLFFARNAIEPLRLTYEDALPAPEATVAAVSALVGVEPRPTGDFGQLGVSVQRDATTEAWRRRFLEEHADPCVMDRI